MRVSIGTDKLENMIKCSYRAQFNDTNQTSIRAWYPKEVYYKWVCFLRAVFVVVGL